MKKTYSLILSLILALIVLPGCSDLLDTKSDRYTFDDDFQMKKLNDSVYAQNGILYHMQKLADRFVLLGELRADLMEPTEQSSRYLKEIYNFNVSKENPYNNRKDYYSVINSCNYLIHYIDTSYVSQGDKIALRTYASAKSLRAWTYLQLALNYDTVQYYTEPITNVKDATKKYDYYTFDQLTSALIEDLLPIKNIQFQSLMFMPVKLILGDLYLWRNEYADAANMYHSAIIDGNVTISPTYTSSWTVSTDGKGIFLGVTDNWYKSFLREIQSAILSSAEYGNQSTVDSLALRDDIVPTQIIKDLWSNAIYYYNATTMKNGDLRWFGSYSKDIFSDQVIDNKNHIVKYLPLSTSTSKAVVTYNNALLYFRYAEAVNRLGCPNLAFTVLKKGLTSNNTTANAVVKKEISTYGGDTIIPTFMQFNNAVFTTNVGTRMRGLGNTNLDTIMYIIPKTYTQPQAIEFVEDKIMEECAAENAFLGFRFHDLMRIAKRRNDPTYLAKIVAAKYQNKADMELFLSDPKNWYLH